MKTTRSLMLLSVTVLAGCSLAVAQAGPTGPVSITAGTSTAIHPDSMQGGNMYGYYMDTDGAGVAGGSLLGKIQIAGDPLTWDPVPVNVTCAGKVTFTTFADDKNRFRITTVNANGALSLQNDAKRQMETHFEGCNVTASLSGFASSSITITHRNFRDAPDLGTIVLTRAAGSKGTALSSTSEGISPKAIKMFEKARGEWQAQTLDHVQGELREATVIDPKFAEAWYQLGNQEQASNPDEARKDYAKAIAVDSNFIRPYEGLLVLDSREAKWKEALADGAQALKMDPRGTPLVWYAYAEGILKAYAAGALPVAKLKVAETSASNSLAEDPLHTVPGTEQLLALILAQEKNYAAAISHLNNCLTYVPAGSDANLVKEQIAKLEQMKAGATAQ